MDTDGVTRAFLTDQRDEKPTEMHTHAKMLIQDARRLPKSGSSGPFILLAHAIELLLKAYLHKKGDSLDDLRKRFGHRLIELVDAVRAKGLTISDSEADNFIGRLDAATEKAALRYHFNFHDLPLVDRLLKFADSLAKDVNATLK